MACVYDACMAAKVEDHWLSYMHCSSVTYNDVIISWAVIGHEGYMVLSRKGVTEEVGPRGFTRRWSILAS